MRKLLESHKTFLESKNETSKELEKRMDEFLGIASHELKTPLASIKAFTQMLQRHFERLGDASSSLYLSKMDAQVDKLTKLVVDLLDVTRIRAGKLELQKEVFYLDDLLEETIEEMQRIGKGHRILKEGKANKYVFADRNRINQLLVNLISNAIKYSPRSDKIIVRVKLEKGYIVVIVQDFGIGISKKNQESIFKPFYSVDIQKFENFPGLGLGLYISSQIAKLHNGLIWVESELDKGSMFYFKLPVKLDRTRKIFQELSPKNFVVAK